MKDYCIYCGQDNEKGHTKDCPLIIGIKGVGTPWGFKPKPNDPEYNLNLGRFRILNTIRTTKNGETIFGPEDKKIAKRVAYESAKFSLDRFDKEIRYIERSKNPIKKALGKRRLKQLKKQKKEIKKLCKLNSLSKEQMKKLFGVVKE